MSLTRVEICRMIRKLRPIPGTDRLCPDGRRRDRREGGAFLTVVVLTAIMALVLSTLASASLQRVHLLRMETNRIRAQAIAEAGLSKVFAMLTADTSVAQGTNPVATDDDFGGGAYEVHVATPMQGVVLITSTGQYRNREYTTVATVRIRETDGGHDDTPAPTTLLGPLGNVALFAGNDITFSGGVNVNLGAFGAHANGNMYLSGGPNIWAGYLTTHGNMTLTGNPQVHLNGGDGRMHADGAVVLRGNINASQITSSTGITGNWGTSTGAKNIAPVVSWPAWFSPLPPVSPESVEAVPTMFLPSLDVEAFRSFAEGNTYYYEGNQNLSRNWLTADILRRTGVNVNNNQTVISPEGGVLFVKGNVTLSSDMHLEGIIVATGNITVSGAATYFNPTPYPALVSVNGNISIGAGSKGPVDGWIYAMNGSVHAGGGASGMTGIVAAQNITIAAGFAIGANPSTSAFISPGQQPGDGGTPDPGTGGGPIKLLSWIR